MKNNVEQGSPMVTVTPGAAPMDSQSAPLPEPPRTRRYSDVEIKRQERRLKARRRAAELLEGAMAVGDNPGLEAIASLVLRTLKIEYCDILQFASDRWVVVVRARKTNGSAPLPRSQQGGDPDFPVTATDVRVEIVQLADHMASLDVLRTEGTVDRIHVFISSRQQLTPLGILTVQSRTSLGLTSDERSFLDALGGLIGAAIDSHALPTGDELSTMKQLPVQDRRSRPSALNEPGADPV